MGGAEGEMGGLLIGSHRAGESTVVVSALGKWGVTVVVCSGEVGCSCVGKQKTSRCLLCEALYLSSANLEPEAWMLPRCARVEHTERCSGEGSCSLLLLLGSLSIWVVLGSSFSLS